MKQKENQIFPKTTGKFDTIPVNHFPVVVQIPRISVYVNINVLLSVAIFLILMSLLIYSQKKYLFKLESIGFTQI